MRTITAAFFTATVFGGATPLAAQAQEYPVKPLHLIVPLLPGAGTDVIARTFANALAQGLGQQVVVENKAGAATTLGANYVAKSTPEQYAANIRSEMAKWENVVRTTNMERLN